jgi:uncharacterized protein involved in oxidation of intracellular sulfur
MRRQAMNVLFILEEAPYGSEKAYLTLRLAMIMQREHSDVKVRIFLLADAVTCALPNQDTPEGYYNLERMIKSIASKGGDINVCSSCMKARGLTGIQLVPGAEVTKFAKLSDFIVDSNKIITL